MQRLAHTTAPTNRRHAGQPGAETRIWPIVCAVALAIFFVRYLQEAPVSILPPNGWYTWWDLDWYLRSALALATGDFSPERHWYPHGYSLLGAVSAALLEIDPFLLPNAFCLVASVLFAARIARAIGLQSAGAAVAILLGTVLWPELGRVWAQPWSSTPATAATLGAMAYATSFVREPSTRVCLPIGLCAGLVAGFRPTDGGVLLLGVAVPMAATLIRHRSSFRHWLAVTGVGALGAVIGVGPTLLLHVLVHGWAASPYMEFAANFGFDPALAPLRWTTVVLDPRPFFPEGAGVSSVFWWWLPGMVGATWALLADGGRRTAHTVLLLPTTLLLVLYLMFRDLNQPFIWLYFNYHYFKLTALVLALYAVSLIRPAPFRRPMALAGAVGLVAIAVSWRAELVVEREEQISSPVTSVVLQQGLSSFGRYYFIEAETGRLGDDLLAVRLADAPDIAAGRIPVSRLIESAVDLRIGDHVYEHAVYFRAVPLGRGILVFALRPLPEGVAELRFSRGLPPSTRVVSLRRLFTFGPPCWIAGCSQARLSHPALIHTDVVYAFSQPETRQFLERGFSVTEGWGVWSDGQEAIIKGRLGAGRPTQAVLVEIEGSAYRRPNGPALDATVFSVRREVGRWRLGTGVETLTLTLEPDDFGPDGVIALTFRIPDPVLPLHIGASVDVRALGIGFRSIRFRS